MSQANRPGLRDTAQSGTDRNPEEPPDARRTATVETSPAPAATEERPTRTEPLERPPPTVPRPTEDQASPVSPLSETLNKLGLLERFEPEARNLNPPLVQIHFQAQQIYDQVFNFYRWRFTDIAYASDSTIAYVAQIIPSADRVAQVTVNAIVNKLIIANRTDGLPVNNLNNPLGPPKGYLFPALATAVITAIGKTSPLWSADQFFIPDLNNAIPAYNDEAGNAVNNCHQFPANPGQDNIVTRFCNAGKIPLRSTDWKIPGGSPHWIVVRNNANGRVTCYTNDNLHPDNFDPPNTVLAAISACTQFDYNLTQYVILKSIAETTLFSLVSEAYEE